MLSSERALGLLHGGVLQEAQEVPVNLASLAVGWLGDSPENCRCGSHVLARPREAGGLSWRVRMNDVGVDFARAPARAARGLARAGLAGDHGPAFI